MYLYNSFQEIKNSWKIRISLKGKLWSFYKNRHLCSLHPSLDGLYSLPREQWHNHFARNDAQHFINLVHTCTLCSKHTYHPSLQMRNLGKISSLPKLTEQVMKSGNMGREQKKVHSNVTSLLFQVRYRN